MYYSIRYFLRNMQDIRKLILKKKINTRQFYKMLLYTDYIQNKNVVCNSFRQYASKYLKRY